MFCPKCGNNLENTEKFCTKCGYQNVDYVENAQAETNTPATTPENATPTEAPKKKSKKPLIITLIIAGTLVLAGAIVAVILLTGNGGNGNTESTVREKPTMPQSTTVKATPNEATPQEATQVSTQASTEASTQAATQKQNTNSNNQQQEIIIEGVTTNVSPMTLEYDPEKKEYFITFGFSATQGSNHVEDIFDFTISIENEREETVYEETEMKVSDFKVDGTDDKGRNIYTFTLPLKDIEPGLITIGDLKIHGEDASGAYFNTSIVVENLPTK